MDDVLALLAVVVALAIAAILVWYVIEFLPIPWATRRAMQLVIALGFGLWTLGQLLGEPPREIKGSARRPQSNIVTQLSNLTAPGAKIAR